MVIDRRPTRQPATLHEELEESNMRWNRTRNFLWRCKIDSCNASFKRKRGLVNHRRQAHDLNIHQANIPDQRKPEEENVQAMREAADHFVNPTHRKRLPKPELIDNLKSNGSDYPRKRSKFEDCDLHSLQNMLFYGLDKGLFESHPSVGFELVASMGIFKELQKDPYYGAVLPAREGFELTPALQNPAQTSSSQAKTRTQQTKNTKLEAPDEHLRNLAPSPKKMKSIPVDDCGQATLSMQTCLASNIPLDNEAQNAGPSQRTKAPKAEFDDLEMEGLNTVIEDRLGVPIRNNELQNVDTISKSKPTTMRADGILMNWKSFCKRLLK